MNIVFASHTYMGGPFVVGSHHLARELGKLGHSVVHVSTPLSPFHLLKLRSKDIQARFRIFAGKNTEEPASGPINSVPMSWLPWELAGPLYTKTGKNWTLPSIRSLRKKHQMEQVDLLLIDQPSFVGFEKLLSPRVTIYRPTDLYSKMTGDGNIAAAEAELLSRVNGLVSTSDPVLAELKPYKPDIPSLLLENGVEYEHFAAPQQEPDEYRSLSGPKAVYVGALDERLDLQALRLLADRMPELNLIIIGPSNPQAQDLFAGYPNVHLLGARKYATIPAYLHYADVSLLPLSDHSANRGRSPMKLYEYAAAGLPVVVTETPELLRREEPFLYFYKEADEFVNQVREALHNKHDKDRVRGLAKRHAWDAKATRLLEFAASL